MGFKTGFNYANPVELVHKYIGTSYDVVKKVHDNLSNITIVATDIDNINTVATDIANVVIVSTSIDNVNNVGSEIDSVITVGDNIADVNIVSANIGDVVTVSSNIDDVVYVAANFQLWQDTINQLVVDVEALQVDLGALQSDVSDLTITVSSNTTNIDNNATAISTLQTDLSNVSNNVLTNETDIDNLETRMDSAETNISNNSTDISDLDTRVTNAETNISSNDTDISDHETRIADLESGSGQTSTDLTELESRVTDNEEDIASLQAFTIGELKVTHKNEVIQGFVPASGYTSDSTTDPVLHTIWYDETSLIQVGDTNTDTVINEIMRIHEFEDGTNLFYRIQDGLAYMFTDFAKRTDEVVISDSITPGYNAADIMAFVNLVSTFNNTLLFRQSSGNTIFKLTFDYGLGDTASIASSGVLEEYDFNGNHGGTYQGFYATKDGIMTEIDDNLDVNYVMVDWDFVVANAVTYDLSSVPNMSDSGAEKYFPYTGGILSRGIVYDFSGNILVTITSLDHSAYYFCSYRDGKETIDFLTGTSSGNSNFAVATIDGNGDVTYEIKTRPVSTYVVLNYIDDDNMLLGSYNQVYGGREHRSLRRVYQNGVEFSVGSDLLLPIYGSVVNQPYISGTYFDGSTNGYSSGVVYSGYPMGNQFSSGLFIALDDDNSFNAFEFKEVATILDSLTVDTIPNPSANTIYQICTDSAVAAI